MANSLDSIVPAVTDLLAVAEGDPAECVRQCQRRLAAGASGLDRLAVLRALGVAFRNLDSPRESVKALRDAVDLAVDLGEESERSEAVISLAASVAMSEGLESALKMLKPEDLADDPLVQAHTLAQRAGLIARTGDLTQARDLFNTAIASLRHGDDSRWLALATGNRGLVHCYLGDFDDAEQDLAEAKGLYEAQGRRSSAAEMTQNLGFVLLQRGRIPEGLDHLARAEDVFVQVSKPLAEVRMDRAEGLVTAGLATEALSVLESAVSAFQEAGMEFELAEAHAAATMASAAAGVVDGARRHGAVATSLFESQGREGWIARIKVDLFHLDLREGRPVHAAEVGQLGDQSAERGQSDLALRAYVVAGSAARVGNDDVEALKWFQKAQSIGSREPSVVGAAQTKLAAAQVESIRGDPTATLRHLRAVQRRLDDHRLLFKSTEALAGAGHLGTDAAELGLRTLLSGGRLSQVFDWLELWRAASLRVPGAPTQGDPELDGMLTQLRTTRRLVADAITSGEPTGAPLREQAALERKIRQTVLRRDGHDEPAMPPSRLRELRVLLGSDLMVVYFQCGGRLRALRVGLRSGRRFDLGDVDLVYAEARRVARRMRRAAVSPDAGFDALGVDELRRMLVDPLDVDSDRVVVVPPARLLSLPWPALYSGRVAVVAPSATSWGVAQGLPCLPDRPSLLAVAGPGLEHSRSEAERIGALYRGSQVLADAAASVDRILSSLSEVDIAHFACHTKFRVDNPMFSTVELADGPLHLYDFERLPTPPSLVVFLSCESAGAAPTHPYDAISLPSVLLRRGTRTVIASVAPVPDTEDSAVAMELLHRFIANGAEPAEAIRQVGRIGGPSVNRIVGTLVAHGA